MNTARWILRIGQIRVNINGIVHICCMRQRHRNRFQKFRRYTSLVLCSKHICHCGILPRWINGSSSIILIIIIKSILRFKIKDPCRICQGSRLIRHPEITFGISPTVSDQPGTIRRRFVHTHEIIFRKIIIPANDHYRMSATGSICIIIRPKILFFIPKQRQIIMIIYNTRCTVYHNLPFYVVLIFMNVDQIRIFQMWDFRLVCITGIQAICQNCLSHTIRHL